MITIIDVSGSISSDEIEIAQNQCMIMGEHDEVMYWSPHPVGNPDLHQTVVVDRSLERVVAELKARGHYVRLITDGFLGVYDLLAEIDEYLIFQRYEKYIQEMDQVWFRNKKLTFIPEKSNA